MLDNYFKRPVLWDCLFSGLVVACAYFMNYYNQFEMPKREQLLSSTTDITTICFTSAGFIFTIITILITFKSSIRTTKENADQNESVFEVFFVSELYFESVRHLKNCVKTLMVIAILGFLLKLSTIENLKLFLFCILGVTIVSLTLWRCLLIMTKILVLQRG